VIFANDCNLFLFTNYTASQLCLKLGLRNGNKNETSQITMLSKPCKQLVSLSLPSGLRLIKMIKRCPVEMDIGEGSEWLRRVMYNQSNASEV